MTVGSSFLSIAILLYVVSFPSMLCYDELCYAELSYELLNLVYTRPFLRATCYGFRFPQPYGSLGAP